MRLVAASLITTAGLAAAAQVQAAEVAPRPAVANLAQAIANHYFDDAEGARIAAALKAEAAEGAYDAFTDPRDLATRLTSRLRPLDRHFSVVWKPPTAGGAPPGPVATLGAPAFYKRANYGLRRVEILNGNLGYIDMRMFADFEFGQPDAPARKAIEAALQLVTGTDAVIIDLRDNGGGSPAMVGYLSSAFTPRGADIYNTFKYRSGTESEAPKDWYPTPRLDTPLYVLISGRTGSAAEAFAYTLKNAGRATIVGEPSAGAANPGRPVEVAGGFSIFVSNGSPISPITKTNWEGDGVKPDVEAPAAKALETARVLALETVLKSPSPAAAIDTRWALEAIRAEISPPTTPPLAQFVGRYSGAEIGIVEGRLAMLRGKRPPAPLNPLGGDSFTIPGESGRRVVFSRDASGVVDAFEFQLSDGPPARYRRDAP